MSIKQMKTNQKRIRQTFWPKNFKTRVISSRCNISQHNWTHMPSLFTIEVTLFYNMTVIYRFSVTLRLLENHTPRFSRVERIKSSFLHKFRLMTERKPRATVQQTWVTPINSRTNKQTNTLMNIHESLTEASLAGLGLVFLALEAVVFPRTIVN